MTEKKSNQQGFTLIELIIVIIILAILSVVAVPKLINIQSDANKSVLSGIEGTLQDAANMSHYKLLLLGKGKTDNFVNMPISPTQTVTMLGGYPHVGTSDSNGNPDEPDIVSISEISDSVNVIREGSWNNGTATFSLAPNCHVIYSETSYDSGTSGPFTPYHIVKDESGC